ncbi:MAG: hypothetical protein R3A13_07595 [Bdellovibrionota bacterium]
MAPKQTFIPVVLISICLHDLWLCRNESGGYNQNGVYNSGYSHNDDYYYQREQDRLRDRHYHLKDERRDLQRERERIARQKRHSNARRERQQQRLMQNQSEKPAPQAGDQVDVLTGIANMDVRNIANFR